ncbi:MAG: hypothetical protein ABW024_06845 [Microbacterium sp.]
MTAPVNDVVQFCRSRSEGRRCTRPLDHPGLHRHRTIMWSDAGADAPRCPGSGGAAAPAAPLADGWPHGLALCPTCLRFVPLEDGLLVDHDTSDPADDLGRAREWFNTRGW